jgi:hypothetical protein
VTRHLKFTFRAEIVSTDNVKVSERIRYCFRYRARVTSKWEFPWDVPPHCRARPTQDGPWEQSRHLFVYWPFSQFLRGTALGMLKRRGIVMSDLTDWIQNYWYELGNLAVQIAMLAVVISYGRKALRILALPLTTSRAASQAQVELLEDLEKLTKTRISKPPTEPETPAYGGVGRMLSPLPEAAVASHDEAARPALSEAISPWRALVAWLQAPMGNRPGPAWRRVSRQAS